MYLTRTLAALTFLVCGLALSAQQKITVSGYVEDEETGEKIIGAQVFDPILGQGAVTNAYGFYSLSLSADSIHLACIYYDYSNWSRVFLAKRDTMINIRMSPISATLQDVEIVAESPVQEQSQMSSIEVPIETIKSLPALLGEVDLIRVLQMLPGVRSGSEGSTGFYVRGGGPDQNLILLDGVPVYNASHLFGFFSVFNADAINRVELIKGGFPARYGGRLSSVLDISMKEGNMHEFHGEGAVGLISSKLTLEGPIIKDKTSFMVSGRRTYLDVLAAPLVAAASRGDAGGGYYFYDVNAKINHKFNDKNRLFLSVYNGKDKFYFKSKDEYVYQGDRYESSLGGKIAWGNTIAALRWNHIYNAKLFSNITVNYSRYNFVVEAEQEDKTTYANGNVDRQRFFLGYDSGIEDVGVRVDFDYYASPNHLVRFGVNATQHWFTPGVTTAEFTSTGGGIDIDTSYGGEVTPATEFAAYIEDDIKIGNRFKVNPGLHASGFYVNGKFYHSIQPRFSGRYLLNENWAVKASWANMQQYIHLLSNTNIGLPTDLWLPATDSVAPQQSWQVAAGVARSFSKIGVDLTVEGYFKKMDGLIEYKEGASFFGQTQGWESKVEKGQGWAYGAEILLQRKIGRISGWIGYTLSWTNRQFENLNNGEIFPYRYDRRHDLSIVSTIKVNDNIDIGVTWVYGTGQAVTLPVAQYLSGYPSLAQTLMGSFPGEYLTSRNGFRMRDYHRLDLGINFSKEKRWYTRTWSFSVYNAYNRMNPFFLYFGYDDNGHRTLRQVTLFPIIPSVAFRMKF